MVSPLCLVSNVSFGTRPRYSLVVDEDVKKPTNQTNKPTKKQALRSLAHSGHGLLKCSINPHWCVCLCLIPQVSVAGQSLGRHRFLHSDALLRGLRRCLPQVQSSAIFSTVMVTAIFSTVMGFCRKF